MGLVFHWEGGEIVAMFTPDERYQGFPGVVHGGVLATVLDEALERFSVTAERWLMTARLVSSRARALVAAGEIRLADGPAEVVAEATDTFLPLPAETARAVGAGYPGFLRAFER
jgi:hypothetical protein